MHVCNACACSKGRGLQDAGQLQRQPCRPLRRAAHVAESDPDVPGCVVKSLIVRPI